MASRGAEEVRIASSLLQAASHHPPPGHAGRARARRDVDHMDNHKIAPTGRAKRARTVPGHGYDVDEEYPAPLPAVQHGTGAAALHAAEGIAEDAILSAIHGGLEAPKERVEELMSRLRDAAFPGYSRYSKEQIALILEIYRALGEVKSAAAHCVATIPGYEKVSPKHIRYWLNPRPRTTVGRPVEPEFEAQVMQHLTNQNVIIVDEGGPRFNPEVSASYDLIRNVAKMIQAQAEWQEVKRVRELQMSNRWVFGFLRRNGLHRLRSEDDDDPYLTDHEPAEASA